MQYFKYSANVVSTDAQSFKLEYAGARIDGSHFQSSIIWCKNKKLNPSSYLDIAKHIYTVLTTIGATQTKVKVSAKDQAGEFTGLRHYSLNIQFCYFFSDTIEDLSRTSGFVFRTYIPENILLETSTVGITETVFKCPTPEPGTGYYPIGIQPNPTHGIVQGN
jgi:hypothetical protein